MPKRPDTKYSLVKTGRYLFKATERLVFSPFDTCPCMGRTSVCTRDYLAMPHTPAPATPSGAGWQSGWRPGPLHAYATTRISPEPRPEAAHRSGQPMSHPVGGLPSWHVGQHLSAWEGAPTPPVRRAPHPLARGPPSLRRACRPCPRAYGCGDGRAVC